ncbi:MAG: carboxypeptidase-like regulatory domain-containing protein [Acidobacteriota bacterium]
MSFETKFSSWLLSLVVALFCCNSVTQAADVGSIRGVVKDTQGLPLAGVAVSLLQGHFNPRIESRVKTDGDGNFEIRDISPGMYALKVSVASYVPLVKTGIEVFSGRVSGLSLVLDNLYQSAVLGVSGGQDGTRPKEKIESVLRSSASTRPILRVLGDSGTTSKPDVESTLEASADSPKKWNDIRGVFSVYNAAYSSDPAIPNLSGTFTEFAVFKDLNAQTSVVFAGIISESGVAEIDSVFRFRNVNGHRPTLRVSLGQLPYFSDLALVSRKFQHLNLYSLDFEDEVRLSQFLSVMYGSEFQMSRPGLPTKRFRPRWAVSVHPSQQTKVTLLRTNSLPRMSRSVALPEGETVEFSSPFEHEYGSRFMFGVNPFTHSELSFEHQLSADRRLVVGAYNDDYTMGRTPISWWLAPSGESVRGAVRGVRVAYRQRLNSQFSGAVGYTLGGGLRDSGADVAYTVQNFHVLSANLVTSFWRSGTQVFTTYRWVSGPSLTVIDPYQEVFDSAAPGLSFQVSQTIPYIGRFIPGKLEAQVDVRNLLGAQNSSETSGSVKRVEFSPPPKSVRGGIQLKF